MTPSASPSPRARGTPLVTPGFLAGFILVVSLFFLWAIANNFNDILIRQFQKALDLNRAEAGLIQFVFYIGYFVMALPAGMIMRKFGYRAGILLGLGLYAVGALLFYPAAEVRQYAAFLAALFILAAGAACLETAANPYVVAFGDPSRAAQRLNLAQAFNGIGAVLAPILGGLFIFSGVELDVSARAALSPADLDAWRASEAATVQLPYLVLAGVVILVAAGVSRVRLPDVRPDGGTHLQPGQARSGTWRRLLSNKVLIGAVVAQFFYVGAQVGVWSYFVDFATYATPQVSERNAAFLLSISLALFMFGRFAGAALMSRAPPARLLIVFAVANVILCGLAATLPGGLAVAALVGTGLFMSIMFPTLFALGVRDLGADQSLGSSLLIMSIIGGALMPPLMGWVSHGHGGLRLALVVPMAAFGVVAAFGLFYRRIERTAAQGVQA
ncbi:L-fucose:H+ symporter permease [Brevundimonas intermedia]|uniref:L-fucose:H+ symporter permease n=1 Tax=Brevundimonas intermedia TaxID=74315 RepID=UPI003207BEFF